MRAARFDTRTRALGVRQVPVPEPGPTEVLVRVRACGICLSDVHLIDGTLPSPLPVVTPGHEASGVVERPGALAAGWRPGQRVVMAGGGPCGTCAMCARGRAEDCWAPRIMGFGYDGAWAEYVVVPAGALTEIGEDLPFEQAAVLADAVATPYAGLVERAALRPGEAVGLWGIGGLGVHAVQIARLVGAAPIIAVDPLPAARQRALDLGADAALDPAGDPAGDVTAEVLRITGGRGLDLAVDLVGANAVLAQAASCLGRRGRLLMIGLSAEPVALGPSALFGVSSHSLLGHLGYAKRHLDQLVDLVAAGRLDVSGSVSDTVALDDVADGVRRLASKEGNPIRLVVTPDR
ncbi:MAG TPA: zinc-binding dehydrogenase [Mycobacteriales bacterium]|nr:zinc-binding dehydrogenase [Mycobacteriales bacterium]